MSIYVNGKWFAPTGTEMNHMWKHPGPCWYGSYHNNTWQYWVYRLALAGF